MYAHPCLAATVHAGTWQEADRPGAGPAGTEEGSAAGAPFSQQWSPAAVAAAGSGPSRLKEPLAIFRSPHSILFSLVP